MEQEKNKNSGLVALVIVLILLVLGLGGYIIYDKVLSNKETQSESNNESTLPTNNDTKTYSYNDLTGLYTYSLKANDIDLTLNNKLYLYDDGTFAYELAYPARYGYLGNYIIDGDKIKLNMLFNFNSGVGLFVSVKKYTITITDVNTLVDSNDYLNKDEIGYTGSITLKRESNIDDNKFLNKYNFEKLLNNQQIDNESTKNKNN